MTRIQKASFAFFGVILGLMAFFTLDMFFNRGKYLAHHFKSYQPSCSAGCHVLAVPPNGNLSSFNNRTSLLCWNGRCIYADNWEFQR